MMKHDYYIGLVLVLITTMPPTTDKDYMWYIGMVMAVIFGMMLKIGIEVKKGIFSWRAFMIQIIITIPVCYIAYNVWLTYELNVQLQTYLFVISFSSVVIAGLLDKLTTMGWNAFYDFLISYIRNKLTRQEEEPKK